MMPGERHAPHSTAAPRTAAESLEDVCRRLELTALLQRMAARDEAALTTFYHIMADRLYSMALRMLGERESAAEALQDCMVRLWNSAGRYDAARGDPFSWSAMLLRGICLDRLRRRAREDRNSRAQQAAAGEIESGGLEDLFFRETVSLVHRAMEQLDPADSECLRATLFRPESTATLAAAFGISPGAMKVRIHRAMQRLRALLEPISPP